MQVESGDATISWRSTNQQARNSPAKYLGLWLKCRGWRRTQQLMVGGIRPAQKLTASESGAEFSSRRLGLQDGMAGFQRPPSKQGAADMVGEGKRPFMLPPFQRRSAELVTVERLAQTSRSWQSAGLCLQGGSVESRGCPGLWQCPNFRFF